MSKIVSVLGAESPQGTAVLKQLLKSKAAGEEKWHIRAFTDDPKSEQALEWSAHGVELVVGRIQDPNSLVTLAKDSYGLFYTLDPWKIGGEDREVKHARVINETCKTQGVKHLIYSSVVGCDKETGIAYFDSKWAIEKSIRALALDYTIFRPTYFMHHFLDEDVEGVQNKKLRRPLSPDFKLQTFALEDLGKLVVHAWLHGDEFKRHTYEVTGDSLSMQEYADLLGWKYEETSMESLPSQGWKLMYGWFRDTGGFKVNVEECRSLFPFLTPFSQWVVNLSHPPEKHAIDYTKLQIRRIGVM